MCTSLSGDWICLNIREERLRERGLYPRTASLTADLKKAKFKEGKKKDIYTDLGEKQFRIKRTGTHTSDAALTRSSAMITNVVCRHHSRSDL